MASTEYQIAQKRAEQNKPLLIPQNSSYTQRQEIYKGTAAGTKK